MASFTRKTFPPPNYAIELTPEEPQIFTTNIWTEYDSSSVHQIKANALKSPYQWHMILVLHHKMFSKKEILDALYSAAEPYILAPSAYTILDDFDFFLIHSQFSALNKLIEAGLTIKVKGIHVSLVLKTNVTAVTGMHQKLSEKVCKSIMEKISGSTLNLNNFSEVMNKRNVDFTLSNKASLNLLCDQINGIERLKDSIEVMTFANNEIKTLESFTKLFGFKTLTTIDLSHNRIEDLEELNFLMHLNLSHLQFQGNELDPAYHNFIREKLPSLKDVNVAAEICEEPAKVNQMFMKRPKDGSGNEPIVVSQTGQTLHPGSLKNKNIISILNTVADMKNDKMWSRVTVHHNSTVSMRDILDELVPGMLSNYLFFPTYYKRFDKHDEFYLHRNSDVIKTLIENNLEFTMMNSQILTFTVNINIAYFVPGQTNWYFKIERALKKRTHGLMLNLHDFANDPEFTHVYIPMNSVRNMQYIVDRVRKRSGDQFTKVCFKRNRCNNISAIEPFITFFAKLKILDLRLNMFDSLGEMCLNTSLNELMLDGNPICDSFSTTIGYVTEVKRQFINLEWLDGCRVDERATLQNFLVTRNAFDCGNEFVKWFFRYFDSFERHRVLDHYNVNSIFTSNLYFVPGNVDAALQSAVFARIANYKKLSRNLIHMSDLNRARENVFQGHLQIGKVFSEIPQTTHDLTHLCVDIPFYEPNDKIVITLTGVFKEEVAPNLYFAFTRTFILRPSMNNKYEITNDQLLLRNASPNQQELFPAMPSTSLEDLQKSCPDVLPTLSEEEKLKILVMQEATQLNEAESVKRLKESAWDVKVALVLFIASLEN